MQTPFDSHLSARAQVDSLAKMHRATGLDQSIASMLRDANALTGLGSFEKRETQDSFGMNNYLLREVRKISSSITAAEQLRKQKASLFGDPFGDMDRYRRMVSEAPGPLSALRSVALYESEAARVVGQSGGSLGAAGASRMGVALSATELIRKQSELLASTFGETLAARWLSSAGNMGQHFTSAKDIIDKHAHRLAGAAAFDAAQLARRMGVPIMDNASFAAIARSSGVAGLLAQLRAFGIDSATLRAVASTVAPEQGDLDELLRDSGGGDEQQRRQLTKAQLVRLWNIFLILNGLLAPMYALWDASQSEARLTREVRAAEARTSEEITASEQRTSEKQDAMAKLMERVLEIAEQEVMAEESFVVRGRVATILREPRSGAGRVAEIFPNQVVTLIEERGKWIRVEYYDWLAREELEGWVLKKHLSRVEGTVRPASGRGFEQ